jgi:ABC-2 type transport system permease protein
MSFEPIGWRAGTQLVARREFVERGRQRAFILSTVISALIIIALGSLPMFLDRPTRWSVGVVDDRGAMIAATARELAVAAEPDAVVTVRRFGGVAEAREAVADGFVRVLIIAPNALTDPVVVVRRKLSDERSALLAIAVQRVGLIERAPELGLTPAEAEALAEPGRFTVDAIDPPDPKREDEVNLARVASVLLFFQMIAFGVAVAGGVVEEKSSRVLEILLARIRPSALLTGKLVGIGALGLAQTAVFVGLGLAAVSVSGAVGISGGSIRLAVSVVAWFVAGYALYSAMFLLAGALAGRQEDLQSTSGLAMTISMVAYVTTLLTMADLESRVARIVSLVPFSAPMAMPMRMASGDATVGEVMTASVLLAATIVGLVALARRVYVRTMLSTTQHGLLAVLRGRAGR